MGLEDFNRKELERIKENLAKEQDLLKQYEDELRVTTDPREKARIRNNIERQKDEIANYKQQYLELQSELSTLSANAIDAPLVNVASNPQTNMNEQTDILLVTVTKIETQAVLQMAEELVKKKSSKHFRNNLTFYELGLIGGARTWLVRSEMGAGGPGGAIITINDAIEQLKPKAVVMVGIAFGIEPDTQPIGQILVSRQILDYELQKIGSTKDGKAKLIPRGDRPQASPRLLNRFRDGDLDWDGTKVDFGLLLSGSKLIDNIDYRDQLRELEPEAVGGEMEGSGLYAAAAAKKVDWILVKAICDYADGHKREGKQEKQKNAAKNAADFVLHVIACGGFVEGK